METPPKMPYTRSGILIPDGHAICGLLCFFFGAADWPVDGSFLKLPLVQAG
jgi:hypothetical protein